MRSYRLLLEIIDELGEKSSIFLTVAVVARVNRGSWIGGVCAPDVVRQQDVLRLGVQSLHFLVVLQSRGKAPIVAGRVAILDVRSIAREGSLRSSEAVPGDACARIQGTPNRSIRGLVWRMCWSIGKTVKDSGSFAIGRTVVDS